MSKEKTVELLTDAKAIASQGTAYIEEFAKAHNPRLKTREECFVWFIGYLHGYITVALKLLED